MVKISSEQVIDNFKNMVGMINDYKKQDRGFPKPKDFEEGLGMSEATVKRYKSVILKQMKKKLLDEFNNEMINHIEKAMKALNEHSKMCEELKKTGDSNERIIASKNIVESHLDAIRLVYDTPEFLKLEGDDNVSENEQEYNYRKTEAEERIQVSIESLLS